MIGFNLMYPTDSNFCMSVVMTDPFRISSWIFAVFVVQCMLVTYVMP